MRILEKTCYSRVLYLMTRGPDFKRAVKGIYLHSGPDFNGEGFNGYIECEVLIEIDQLDVFVRIWNEWLVLTSGERALYYTKALGK